MKFKIIGEGYSVIDRVFGFCILGYGIRDWGCVFISLGVISRYILVLGVVFLVKNKIMIG